VTRPIARRDLTRRGNRKASTWIEAVGGIDGTGRMRYKRLRGTGR
jgi:hypothetical protein